MKLSIITINYNNRLGLEKTVQSVLLQTFRDFDWIIIDGGSDDGSRELIEETAAKCKQLSYWCSERDEGIYNAMNKGIKNAKGKYCLFLNSGDYFYGDVLNIVCSKLSSNIGFVVGRVMEEKGTLTRDFTKTQYSVAHLILYPFPHQACFINKAVFDKYGLYDEKYRIIADWVLYIDALILGNENVAFIQEIVSKMEYGGVSSNSSLYQDEIKRMKQKLSTGTIKSLEMARSYESVIASSNFTLLVFRILYRLSNLIHYFKKEKNYQY